MDQVDTLHVAWSEVLCCSIMTHLSDLECKVTDLELLKLLLKAFRTVYCLMDGYN